MDLQVHCFRISGFSKVSALMLYGQLTLFSHAWTNSCLPGLNQYLAAYKVFYTWASDSSIPSLTFKSLIITYKVVPILVKWLRQRKKYDLPLPRIPLIASAFSLSFRSFPSWIRYPSLTVLKLGQCSVRCFHFQVTYGTRLYMLSFMF